MPVDALVSWNFVVSKYGSTGALASKVWVGVDPDGHALASTPWDSWVSTALGTRR